MATEGPNRLLLKLSGNVLSGAGAAPFDPDAIDFIGAELAAAADERAQLAVVVGGGNIIRGATFSGQGPGRLRADYAGMLATCINALVLRDALEARGVPAAHYSAFPVARMADAFRPERAAADLDAGRIVLLAGGTGNPYFTTDTAAALRAVELGARLVLKATRVDGVYSADPERDPEARLYQALTYREVLSQKLGVMDLPAISLCMEHALPVRVFNYAVSDNIRRAIAGEPVGTFIGDDYHAS